MKIDVLTTDRLRTASPIDVRVRDIYGRGVGGAELSLLTWAEVMTAKGCTVTIYNSYRVSSETENGIHFKQVGDFNPDENRDAVILWRSPNSKIKGAKGKRVFWSCDQQTIGDYKNDVFPFVHDIVTISPFHAAYFERRYGAGDSLRWIDLGVRSDCFTETDTTGGGDKVCIFCSVPDRGLDVIRSVWPKIKDRHNDASLIVTSDYSLWGRKGGVGARGNDNGIEFMGNVNRMKLIEYQKMSKLTFSSIVYPELFCISSAECQVSGVIPVTGCLGALATTNKLGYPIHGNPLGTDWQARFISTVDSLLRDNTRALQELIKGEARKRFDWEKITDLWVELLSQERPL